MTNTDEVEKLLPERIFIHPGAEMEMVPCLCGKSVAYVPEQSAQPLALSELREIAPERKLHIDAGVRRHRRFMSTSAREHKL